MPLFRGNPDLDRWQGSIAAIGNFDGVHLGHQAMMAELRHRADAAGTPALAVTFDPPPVELLRPDIAPPRLMRLDQKTHCLMQSGADAVLAFATDAELLELTPEAFFHEILVRRLNVRGLVEGPNFRFGRDRRGDLPLLSNLCSEAGITLTAVEPVMVGDRMVSSSIIRQLVTEGDLTATARLLGRPHETIGTVVHGADRGGRLGFPTANLAEIATLLPPDGVYAGRTEIDGRSYAAAIHIGLNSTFDENERKFEAHLLDFTGNLYGQNLRIELIEKVRDTVRYESSEALVEQLKTDCLSVRTLVATHSAGR